jgi:hypothetical protein
MLPPNRIGRDIRTSTGAVTSSRMPAQCRRLRQGATPTPLPGCGDRRTRTTRQPAHYVAIGETGGINMTVIAHVVLRDVSQEQYDAVRAECGWLEDVPVGGLAHLTWWEETTITTSMRGRARRPSGGLARTAWDRPWPRSGSPPNRKSLSILLTKCSCRRLPPSPPHDDRLSASDRRPTKRPDTKTSRRR